MYSSPSAGAFLGAAAGATQEESALIRGVYFCNFYHLCASREHEENISGVQIMEVMRGTFKLLS